MLGYEDSVMNYLAGHLAGWGASDETVEHCRKCLEDVMARQSGDGLTRALAAFKELGGKVG